MCLICPQVELRLAMLHTSREAEIGSRRNRRAVSRLPVHEVPPFERSLQIRQAR